MATTHFSGAVNSANGFEGPTIAAADGTPAITIANSTGAVTITNLTSTNDVFTNLTATNVSTAALFALDGSAAGTIANSTGVVSITALTSTLTGNVTGIIFDSVQNLTGAGAIDVTHGLTAYTSNGSAQTLTMANGSAVGQVKRIVHTVDGGSGVLTPTAKIGFSTITFTNVGDAVTLSYTTPGWAVVGISGAVLG